MTSNGIKPIVDSVSVEEMRTLIIRWHQAQLTDKQFIKMEQLFLGVPCWMTEEGVYPSMHFLDISKHFKFKSLARFILCITKCAGFGFIWNSENHAPENLLAFYSPLWYQPSPERQRRVAAHNNIFNNNSKNINYTENNIIKYNSNTIHHTMDGNEAVELKSQITSFIDFLCQDDDAYNAFTKDINLQMETALPVLKSVESTDKHPVNIATRRFLDVHLTRHFQVNADKFRHARHNQGRLFWLQNLRRFPCIQTYIKSSIEEIRALMAKDQDVILRQNRPLSPHEYQDLASGQRFYYSPSGAERKRIPAEAPPRPSATAEWNKFAKEWEEGYNKNP